MSVEWITDAQNEIYTKVKTRASKKLKTEYKNLFFTMDEEAQLETHFPTVYIRFLPYGEIGTDLEGNNVNGIICGCDIEVTSSKAQGREVATKVANEVVEQFKRLRFRIMLSPTPMNTGNETKRVTARVQRNLGSGDIIE